MFKFYHNETILPVYLYSFSWIFVFSIFSETTIRLSFELFLRKPINFCYKIRMFSFLCQNQPEWLIHYNFQIPNDTALIFADKRLLLNHNTFLIHFQFNVFNHFYKLSF